MPIYITLFILVITQILFLTSMSLDQTIVIMFFRGMAFPGKNIVILGYILEHLLEKSRETYISIYCFAEPVMTIYLAFHYEFFSRNWMSAQILFLVTTLVPAMIMALNMHESAKYLYTKGRFDEAREAL